MGNNLKKQSKLQLWFLYNALPVIVTNIHAKFGVI